MKKFFISELEHVLFIESREKEEYLDEKKTGRVQSVVIHARIRSGEIQILFPPRSGAAEKFNSQYSFGDLVNLEDLGDIQDTQVGIYNGNLTVKVLSEYKEDEL